MKRFFLSLLLALSTIFLVACTSYPYTLDQLTEAVAITYQEGDSQSYVTADLILPTVSTLDEEATITWFSEDTSIISNRGLIMPDTVNRLVLLTYRVTYHGQQQEGYIYVTVIGAEETYVITFQTNGGTPMDPITRAEGLRIRISTTTIKDGFIFNGWYLDAALTKPLNFVEMPPYDFTLYAKWGNDIDFTGIYDHADGLTGSELITFLYQIVTADIAGSTQDYGDARYTLADTDQDPTNPNHVILIYLGTSVSGFWDNGQTWNREHVWPQSLLGTDADKSTVNMASDLHNLKPANPSANSSRGNKWFADATTSVSYEPRDEVKGDIARILFYMAVRYHQTLTLVNLSTGQEPAPFQMGDLATLLAWNLDDPVDAFESSRNDMIESIQGNRNPFIDYPEFADLIW